MTPIEEQRIISTPIPELINAFNETNKTVDDFNKIFNLSKIEGKGSSKVTIGAMLTGNGRVVTIGKRSIGVDLKGLSTPKEEIKHSNGIAIREKVEKVVRPVNPEVNSKIFQLAGNTFKVYVFISMYGPIAGASFIEANVDLSERSIRSSLKELEDANLIERKEVFGNTKMISVVV